ncbi:MAG: hypothetical protein KZQ72_17050 [Candidatus Thiodiazotropha sp. (ex Cardiolucina cf. quadrata)]|nr:hypothetical protein [Candidatus Thiodiazotropha sp. (ex Cardiolucina cf. quadrata)]
MQRQRLRSFIAICLLPLSAVAASTDGSEKKPIEQPAHDHRGAKQITLENGEGATITLWKPDLSTQTLNLEHGGITIPKTGLDNYHVVVAEKDWGNHKEAVIRYEYMFGRPSKQSPSKLTAVEKTDFEIVPDPIPREHYRYHTLQTWGFLVRLHGKPLSNLELTLQTTHGSQQTVISDQYGRVEFRSLMTSPTWWQVSGIKGALNSPSVADTVKVISLTKPNLMPITGSIPHIGNQLNWVYGL